MSCVETLLDLFRSLRHCLDLEEMLSQLDQQLRRVVEYQTMAVHVVADLQVVPVFAAGTEFRSLAILEHPLGQGIAGHVAASLQPVVNAVAGHDDRCYALALPLVAYPGSPAAVLALYRGRTHAFSDEDLKVLLRLAPDLAAAIDNALKYRIAQQTAGFDPDTGLANRRSLFERMDAELARARRSNGRLAVFHCILDGLEAIDGLCDAGGARRALKRFGAELKNACREYDLAARTGNDIVLVLPDFRLEACDEKRQQIAAIANRIALSTGLPLSARVGAACFPADGQDADDLMAVARLRNREPGVCSA